MPGESILVVDDNPQNVLLLKDLLTAMGYETIEASSGEEALRKVEEQEPDLVLLDIMMPGMDGYEVCRRLRLVESTRLLPVIMVTALRETEDKVKGLDAGADDFISKPIERQELLARVRSMLRIKRLQDDLEERNRELARRNEELVRLEKLRDDLIHMVVHDLNNPLTAIMGRAELMLLSSKEGLTERQREDLVRIRQSGVDLSRMIRNLLDIRRMEEGRLERKPEPVRMEEIVRARVEEMRVSGTFRDHDVTVQAAPDLPVVNGDRDLLSRVVTNLLVNAVRYTPPEGKILAEIERSPESGVRVSISDTGPGIAEEFQEKVFEKFWQVEAKEAGERVGSGLGLAFCRMAVEAHGGRIWVESEVRKGSVFRFTIPDVRVP